MLKEPADATRQTETLAEVTARIIGEDALERVRAAKLVARTRSDDDTSEGLALLLSSVEPTLRSAKRDVKELIAALLKGAEALPRLCGPIAQSECANPTENFTDNDGTGKAARRSAAELRAYFVFAATVLALFGRARDPADLKRAAEGGIAEQLAQARQAFADGAETALSRVDAVRTKLSLE